MSQPGPVSALRIMALALALTLSACRPGEKKAFETPASSPPGPAAALPGALAKPVDQYSGEELYVLTRRLVFTGGVERSRRCKGEAGCLGARPKSITRVRVDAVDGEDSLSAAALPASGAIAARALNLGTAADALYGMTPGERFEYYVIVTPGKKTGTAVWRLEQLEMAGNQRAHRMVATGAFTECHHPFERGARADFKTCAEAAAIHPASFAMPQTLSDSPIWIGCAAGCCTADPNAT